MYKTSLIGLSIAVLIPLVCYLWLDYASTNGVNVPRKFLLDTVIETLKDGKYKRDSVWHRTANFSFENQLGDTLDYYSINGKIVVMDFIFTHCRSICPALTRNMSKLQSSFLNTKGLGNRITDTSIVQFLSISIDPKRDSAEALKTFADRFKVSHFGWWFARTNPKVVYDLAFNELRVDQFNGQPLDSDFVHTNRFVLLDKNHIVRGYYNGMDTTSIALLAKDIGLLLLEKDKSNKSKLFSEIVSLSWLWVLIFALVVVFIFFFLRNSKF